MANGVHRWSVWLDGFQIHFWVMEDAANWARLTAKAKNKTAHLFLDGNFIGSYDPRGTEIINKRF